MRYQAFGLVIESDLPLPELEPAEGAASWHIVRTGRVETPAFERYFTLETAGGRPWMFFSRDGERYLLEQPDFGSFVLGADRTIEVVAGGGSPETLRHLLIDQVLPMALAHSGELVLHAAAVEWNGRAVALIGSTGSGKSTLAAACVDAGASLVTDDALVLRGSPSEPVTSVSYGGVRLWSDSGARYDTAPEPTYVAQYSDKRRVNLRASSAGAIPLAAAFTLENGEAIDVGTVAARDALMLLVENTYRLDTVGPAPLRREFTALQQLVSAFPVRRLRYPRRYEALGDVIAVIRNC